MTEKQALEWELERAGRPVADAEGDTCPVSAIIMAVVALALLWVAK